MISQSLFVVLLALFHVDFEGVLGSEDSHENLQNGKCIFKLNLDTIVIQMK